MYLHANAKLGLAGRLALVRAIEEGMTLKQAAACFSVSAATAHRWWHRWLDGGRQVSALLDRSSRPQRSPRLLSLEMQEQICDCRRQTGWGPRLIAGATGFAHSTVWKVLKRAGISRRSAAVKEPANSYEWPCPGDLLHMDTSRYARFLRPGHRVTRDRSQRSRAWMRPETRVGYDFAHAIRRRPLPARLRRAPRRREGGDRHQLRRTSARLLRRAQHHRQTADDRQRLQLHPQPLTARTAPQPRHPPPHDRALPPTHQRQGRTLPPDDGPRMGLRTRLPHTSTPQRRPATLARQLQPATTTQLNRRPATDQPRSQPP